MYKSNESRHHVYLTSQCFSTVLEKQSPVNSMTIICAVQTKQQERMGQEMKMRRLRGLLQLRRPNKVRNSKSKVKETEHEA